MAGFGKSGMYPYNTRGRMESTYNDFKQRAADYSGYIMNAGREGLNGLTSGQGIAPAYAGLANGAMGAVAGVKAIQGIDKYQNAKKDTEDLVNDILASAAGNQNYRYDLSTDQLQMLRRLQNGTYDTSGDFEIESLFSNLGDTATGAGLGFVTGGPVGAILGGLGGVVDGVSSGMTRNQEKITADLQSLYDALYESEMRNKAIKRDAATQRYANSLYGY